eukprot:CAMPEP_0119262630 /NCGR_PEP_ID=MMETSP1329-20130426/2298_1 /TAXON_ID=114041 /ORGANISM="Genus nov. species nov., Strain RCC1024" /LENGTH=172 /DNA_ID=CAMNT_0007262291 /DNA_START=3 /DNA_END=522 /DNA_ORIENTATION=+
MAGHRGEAPGDERVGDALKTGRELGKDGLRAPAEGGLRLLHGAEDGREVEEQRIRQLDAPADGVEREDRGVEIPGRHRQATAPLHVRDSRALHGVFWFGSNVQRSLVRGVPRRVNPFEASLDARRGAALSKEMVLERQEIHASTRVEGQLTNQRLSRAAKIVATQLGTPDVQ